MNSVIMLLALLSPAAIERPAQNAKWIHVSSETSYHYTWDRYDSPDGKYHQSLVWENGEGLVRIYVWKEVYQKDIGVIQAEAIYGYYGYMGLHPFGVYDTPYEKPFLWEEDCADFDLQAAFDGKVN